MKPIITSVCIVLCFVFLSCNKHQDGIKTLSVTEFTTQLTPESNVVRVKVINNKEALIELDANEKIFIPLNSSEDLTEILNAIETTQLVMPPVDRSFSSSVHAPSFFSLANSFFLILLLAYLLFLSVIVDVLRSRFKNDVDKLIWVLLIIFLPFIGVVLYLIMGRTSKLPPANHV